MTQYVINIGAVPDDGTGDPLRTAFNETNLNFDQVFAAGPVLSNVQIANNKILTLNTNGNLILAPNGIGVVQSNVSILPNLANVRDLGSSTQRWRTVYTQYLDVSANLNIAGNIIYNGDLNVAGNLTVQGNIIQVGNIVTETLTIQLANAASTANAANGSGITVGANDNIATILYNSTGNVWTTNIGLSSVGNISAPYFIGNGSQLTGLAATYGNANVVTLLSGFGSNTVSTTGNITGGYFIGNGSQLTGLAATYGNSNVVTLLAAYGSNTISTTGNITANNFFTTANLKIGLNPDILVVGDHSEIKVFGSSDSLQIGWEDTTPAQDNIAYIQFNDAFGTIGFITGNTQATQYAMQFDAEGNLVVSGNINNVSKLTNIGNITIDNGNAGNINTWSFNTDGTTVFPTLTVDLHNGGNTQGQTLQFGDPNQQAFITGPAPLVEGYAAQRLIIQGQYGNTGEGGDVYIWGGDSQANGGDIKIYAGDADTAGRGGNIHIEGGRGTTDAGEITLIGGRNDDGVGARVDLTGGLGSTGGGNINLTGGYGALTGGNVAITGGISGNGLAEYGNVNIAAGASTWSFKNNGTTEFPNNIINPGNNQPLTLRTQSSGNAYTVMYQSSNSWEAYAEDDNTEANDAYAWIKADLITANTPRVFINNVRGGDGLSSTWTFDDAGNLTLPNGALLKDTSGDSVAFGQNAGANNQSQHSVAIGPEAGMNNQGEDSVAIGWLAGRDDQTRFGIAIGWNAGSNTQGQHAQAYGHNAGAYYQKNSAIALGENAARYLQGQSAIAIGSNAGYGGPQGTTVASMPSPDVVRVFGSTSTLYNGMTAVGGSIAPTTGITIVGLSGEDITLSSVPAEPLTNGTTLYFYPAQSTGAVAVGEYSAQTLQGQRAVAVGYRAGQTRQGNSSVSIGEDAGYITQGANAVSMGSAAGFDTQGATAISIGLNAGRTTQGQASIAMGFSAGFTGQGNSSVALGEEAGYTSQGQNSIAIGRSAGQSSQGNAAIAMGWTAAQTTQGNAAIAIGEDAGRYYQGEYSIAIGRTAGFNLQANNSIILNATGLHVNAVNANSFIVQPIRNAAAGNVLYYDEFTGEITFDVGGSGGLPVANGTSNFDIATANGNATITANSSSTWTFGTDGALTLPASSGQIGLAGYPNGIDLYNNNGGTGYVRMNYADESLISADSGGAHVQTTGGTWDFDTTGNLTAPGNVSAVGNIIGGNIVTSGSGGDITLTGGNITGAGNISGNYFIGNGSQLTGIATSYGNSNVANFLADYGSNTISTTGNITAANFFGNGSTLSNVATQVTGTWTVPVGNSTQSFTVSNIGTYSMWVDCNITNGILAWNATATVTNNNVPVVGAQYAWVYNGGGTPVDFTSIPNQFIGTSNTIVRSSVAASATTNRFDFGINNTSGGNVTVRYGYTKVS